jgi:hypothetical protein
MGAEYLEIDEGLSDFICQQRIFFVASAPLAEDGHVNVSPKGLDSLRILGPREVAYLDLTGSGIETVAHLRENGRLTLMFCAFQGRPRIVRLQGRGANRRTRRRRLEPIDRLFSAVRQSPIGRAPQCGACGRFVRVWSPTFSIRRRAHPTRRLGRPEGTGTPLPNTNPRRIGGASTGFQRSKWQTRADS